MSQPKLPPEEVKDLARQMAFIAGLNPGIRLTVMLLRRHGFETVDSGDGETHKHECDRDYPYVSIKVAHSSDLVSEAHRLAAVLLENLRDISVFGAIGEREVAVQASYDPATCFPLLDVTGIHDRMLKETE